MNKEELTLLARVKAKAGKEEEVKRVLLALVGPTHQEQGSIEYRLHESKDDPAVFFFYEVWASEDVLNEHMGTAHLQGLLARADELFEGEMDEQFISMEISDNNKQFQALDTGVEGLEQPKARLGDSVRSAEEHIILQTLQNENGSRKITAEKLGISPRTLRYKIARMKESGVAVPC